MLPFGSLSVGWLYLRKRGQWLDKSGLVEMPYNRVRVVSAACIVVHWRNGDQKMDSGCEMTVWVYYDCPGEDATRDHDTKPFKSSRL